MKGKTMPKPVPQPTPETHMFWDKAKAHELWLPRCDNVRTIMMLGVGGMFATAGAVVLRRE